MKQFIPFLNWISLYNKDKFKADFIGGLTVGIVLIPQGIAYALIAGLPPIYGLYSALLPQLMYMLFGTSQKVAVGPVAMDSLIVAAGVSTLAVTGTEGYVTLCILLTLMVGTIQLLLGVGKLGFIVNFLSKPVISGFTSAAAIVIGLSQLKNFTGVNLPRSNRIQEIFLAFFEQIHEVSFQTLIIGICTVVILFAIKIFKLKIPGPLLVVILGILILNFTHESLYEVAVLKEIPSGLPNFSMPSIELSSLQELFPIALTLAIIGFLETISIGKAMEDSTDDTMIQPNKELIALGMMNALGAFFKAYPSTASFSRSAVNLDAGSKTPLAALFSVLIIILTLLFLTPYFYFLPKTVLASIIIVSVVKLVDVKEAKKLWKLNRVDFWMMITTFIGTLFWGVKEGIAVGVILSLIMLIARTSKPHVAILGRIPNTNIFRNINRFEEVEVEKDILIFRFDARLYFANSNFFNEELQKQAYSKGDQLKLIIIDCECVNGMDSTAAQMLETSIRFYNDKGIDMYFTNIKGPVRDVFRKSGIVQRIGDDHFFINNHGAIDYYKTGNLENHNKLSNYIHQSNTD